MRALVHVSVLVGLMACSALWAEPPAPTLSVPTTVVAPLPPLSGPLTTPAATAQSLPVPTALLFDQAASELIAVPSQQRLALHSQAYGLMLAPNKMFLAYRAGDTLMLAALATGQQRSLGITRSPASFTRASDALLYVLSDGTRWQLRRIMLLGLRVEVVYETTSQPPPREFQIAPDDQSIAATVQDTTGVHIWTLALRPSATPTLIYERPTDGSHLAAWLPQGLLVVQPNPPPDPPVLNDVGSSLLQIDLMTHQTSVFTPTDLWPVPSSSNDHLALFGNWSGTPSTPTICSLRLYAVATNTISAEVFDDAAGGPICKVGFMRWSPDGKHLLVVYTWGADRGVPGYDAVLVIDAAGGARQIMQFDSTGSDETLSDAAWRDDTTALLLTSDPATDRVALSEVTLSRFQKDARVVVFERAAMLKPYEIWAGALVAAP